MTWREIEGLIRRERFQVVVELSKSRNKYWIKKNQVHYPITARQFDNLLENGYIDPNYRVTHEGRLSSEALIYEGR